ncbi:glycosyltransferase family 4 protein [Algihabitans albus]|uniref:glycosyltransferase family 4 protein n=1 Tax=Algihabitans albus TaxID=2164067 RepID=UPI000E5D5FA4|nr:glycosyltransferase family 4 protein [Algihabitans albus]
MRVLLISNLFPPEVLGGAEIMVEALAEGLLELDCEVTVAALAADGAWRLERPSGLSAEFVSGHPLGNDLLTTRRVRWRRAAWYLLGEVNLLARRRLGELMDKLQPDVVHTSNLTGFGPQAMAAAAARGLPLVHTIQDYGLVCLRGTMFRGGRPCSGQCGDCRVGTTLRRAGSQTAHSVVGLSQHVLEQHLENGYFQNSEEQAIVRTWHLEGVPQHLPLPSEGAPRQRPDPVTFGYIGRLHPTKGIDRLIEAMRRLDADSARLVIGGTGNADLEADLKQQAAGLPVEFLGWVDAKSFYPMIDALVVPSIWHEPLGMVAREAHWWGRPVLAARRGGLAEIVRHGTDGLLFDPDDPAEFACALGDFARNADLRRVLVQGARTAAPADGRGGLAERYREIYRRAIESRTLRPATAQEPLSEVTGP